MNSEIRRVILVIEGGTELRNFGREILQKNFQVVEANNGDDGLAMARQIVPDLILCDTELPGLSGLDVCGVLKSDVATDHMSVILLGAKKEEELRALSVRADDFVLQPFDQQLLT